MAKQRAVSNSQTAQPREVMVPAPTWGTFVEWNAHAPGNVCVNVAQCLWVQETGDGSAELVFPGVHLLLQVPYADVAARILGTAPVAP